MSGDTDLRMPINSSTRFHCTCMYNVQLFFEKIEAEWKELIHVQILKHIFETAYWRFKAANSFSVPNVAHNSRTNKKGSEADKKKTIYY